MRKLFLLCLFLLAFASASTAQTGSMSTAQTGSIKGRVFRKSDNRPLYNATVRIKDSKKSTRTDNDGNYSFEELAAGQDYEIEMTKRPIYDDGGTTVNVKSNVANNAADVSLAKLPPNAIERQRTIHGLQALLDQQNIDELESIVEVLVARCKDEDDDPFCKDIQGLGKALQEKKLEIAKVKLNHLVAGVK